MSITQATTSPSPLNTAPPELKLTSELRTLDSFLDDWLKVYTQHRVLSKKASLSRAEFDALKSSSDGIKNRCSDFQQAIRSIVKKLKEADRWNALDDEVLAKTNDDQKLRSELRDGGGLKHLLDDASSQFCSQAEDEITGPVETLRPRLGAQVHDLFLDQGVQDYGLRMVRASYNPDPPMFTKFARCVGATIRVAVHLVATGTSGGAGGSYGVGNKECFCYDHCSGAPTT
jgi:hypothetical protein